jgi:formylglycine-generating enzyme required for sulfatase activity
LVPNLNNLELSNRNSVKEVYRSSFGCVAYAGKVQEWTSSQWTPRYWSGKESESVGFSTTNLPDEVSARGCSSVQTPSLTDRVRASISSFEIPRIFRRVWAEKSLVPTTN